MASDKLRVLLVLGSIRDGRQGLKVAKFMKEALATRNLEVIFYDLLEMDFPMVKQPVHFYGPDRSVAPQILVDCERTIREVDAIVVVTPEYNNSIPASLKNFLDAFPDSAFGFKPSGITCYSQGTYGGLGAAIALRTTLGILACPCVSRMFAIPYVQNVLGDDGNALDDKLNTDVKPMLDQLVWAATAVRNHRKCAELPVSSFFGS